MKPLKFPDLTEKTSVTGHHPPLKEKSGTARTPKGREEIGGRADEGSSTGAPSTAATGFGGSSAMRSGALDTDSQVDYGLGSDPYSDRRARNGGNIGGGGSDDLGQPQQQHAYGDVGEDLDDDDVSLSDVDTHTSSSSEFGTGGRRGRGRGRGRGHGDPLDPNGGLGSDESDDRLGDFDTDDDDDDLSQMSRTPPPLEDGDGNNADNEEARRLWLARKNVEQSKRLDKIHNRVQNLLLRFEHGTEDPSAAAPPPADSTGVTASTPAAAAAAADTGAGSPPFPGARDEMTGSPLEELDIGRDVEDQFFNMYISKYKVDSLIKNYNRISDTRDQVLVSLDQWMEEAGEAGEVTSDEEDPMFAVSSTLGSLRSADDMVHELQQNMGAKSQRLNSIVNHIVSSCSEKVRALQPALRQDNVIKYKRDIAESRREVEMMRKELLRVRKELAESEQMNRALRDEQRERQKDHTTTTRRLTLDLQRAVEREAASREKLHRLERERAEEQDKVRSTLSKRGEEVAALHAKLRRAKATLIQKFKQGKLAQEAAGGGSPTSAFRRDSSSQQGMRVVTEASSSSLASVEPPGSAADIARQDSLDIFGEQSSLAGLTEPMSWSSHIVAPGIVLEFPVDSAIPYLAKTEQNAVRQVELLAQAHAREIEAMRHADVMNRVAQTEAVQRAAQDAEERSEERYNQLKSQFEDYRASTRGTYEQMNDEFAKHSAELTAEVTKLRDENARLSSRLAAVKTDPEIERLFKLRDEREAIDRRISSLRQRLRGLAITQGADHHELEPLEAELEQCLATGERLEMEIGTLQNSPATRELRRIGDENSSLQGQVRDLKEQLSIANAMFADASAARDEALEALGGADGLGKSRKGGGKAGAKAKSRRGGNGSIAGASHRDSASNLSKSVVGRTSSGRNLKRVGTKGNLSRAASTVGPAGAKKYGSGSDTTTQSTADLQGLLRNDRSIQRGDSNINALLNPRASHTPSDADVSELGGASLYTEYEAGIDNARAELLAARDEHERFKAMHGAKVRVLQAKLEQAEIDRDEALAKLAEEKAALEKVRAKSAASNGRSSSAASGDTPSARPTRAYSSSRTTAESLTAPQLQDLLKLAQADAKRLEENLSAKARLVENQRLEYDERIADMAKRYDKVRAKLDDAYDRSDIELERLRAENESMKFEMSILQQKLSGTRKDKETEGLQALLIDRDLRIRMLEAAVKEAQVTRRILEAKVHLRDVEMSEGMSQAPRDGQGNRIMSAGGASSSASSSLSGGGSGRHAPGDRGRLSSPLAEQRVDRVSLKEHISNLEKEAESLHGETEAAERRFAESRASQRPGDGTLLPTAHSPAPRTPDNTTSTRRALTSVAEVDSDGDEGDDGAGGRKNTAGATGQTAAPPTKLELPSSPAASVSADQFDSHRRLRRLSLANLAVDDSQKKFGTREDFEVLSELRGKELIASSAENDTLRRRIADLEAHVVALESAWYVRTGEELEGDVTTRPSMRTPKGGTVSYKIPGGSGSAIEMTVPTPSAGDPGDESAALIAAVTGVVSGGAGHSTVKSTVSESAIGAHRNAAGAKRKGLPGGATAAAADVLVDRLAVSERELAAARARIAALERLSDSLESRLKTTAMVAEAGKKGRVWNRGTAGGGGGGGTTGNDAGGKGDGAAAPGSESISQEQRDAEDTQVAVVIEALGTEIATLERTVAAKDTEIVGLLRELAQKDAEVETLRMSRHVTHTTVTTTTTTVAAAAAAAAAATSAGSEHGSLHAGEGGIDSQVVAGESSSGEANDMSAFQRMEHKLIALSSATADARSDNKQLEEECRKLTQGREQDAIKIAKLTRRLQRYRAKLAYVSSLGPTEFVIPVDDDAKDNPEAMASSLNALPSAVVIGTGHATVTASSFTGTIGTQTDPIAIAEPDRVQSESRETGNDGVDVPGAGGANGHRQASAASASSSSAGGKNKRGPSRSGRRQQDPQSSSSSSSSSKRAPAKDIGGDDGGRGDPVTTSLSNPSQLHLNLRRPPQPNPRPPTTPKAAGGPRSSRSIVGGTTRPGSGNEKSNGEEEDGEGEGEGEGEGQRHQRAEEGTLDGDAMTGVISSASNGAAAVRITSNTTKPKLTPMVAELGTQTARFRLIADADLELHETRMQRLTPVQLRDRILELMEGLLRAEEETAIARRGRERADATNHELEHEIAYLYATLREMMASNIFISTGTQGMGDGGAPSPRAHLGSQR